MKNYGIRTKEKVLVSPIKNHQSIRKPKIDSCGMFAKKNNKSTYRVKITLKLL